MRLIRRTNFNPGVAVGETIENLQFTYNYVSGSTCWQTKPPYPAGYSENQIRSVDVYMGARSDNPINSNGTHLYPQQSADAGLPPQHVLRQPV